MNTVVIDASIAIRYDRLHLALAIERGCRFGTADERFLRKLQGAHWQYLTKAVSLTVAEGEVWGSGRGGRLTGPQPLVKAGRGSRGARVEPALL